MSIKTFVIKTERKFLGSFFRKAEIEEIVEPNLVFRSKYANFQTVLLLESIGISTRSTGCFKAKTFSNKIMLKNFQSQQLFFRNCF